MLVLSRKTQERIQIGDNVVVTVLRVKGNMVRIGIEAPKDVRVLRAELPSQAATAVGNEAEPDVRVEKPGSSLRKLAEAVLARRSEVVKSTGDESPAFAGMIECELAIEEGHLEGELVA